MCQEDVGDVCPGHLLAVILVAMSRSGGWFEREACLTWLFGDSWGRAFVGWLGWGPGQKLR